MSLILMDGFDTYAGHDLSADSRDGGGGIMDSSGYYTKGFGLGRFTADTATGVGYAYTTSWRNWTVKPFNTASDITVGFRYRRSALDDRTILSITGDDFLGTVRDRIAINISGPGAMVMLVPGAAPIISPVNTFFANTWHYIEFRLKCASDAGGYAELRIDGNTVCIYTGPTVLVSTGTFMNLLNFSDTGSSEPAHQYDDLYIVVNDGTGLVGFLGDVVVQPVFPDLDAGPNEMSQFGGGVSHASAVREVTGDGDVSYLYSNVSGQSEMFTLSDIPADIIDVLAVQVASRAKKQTAGVAKFKLNIKTGTTQVQSSPITPPTSYQQFAKIWEKDPTGATWTKSNLQASKIGLQVV